jgi:hypothetical protein
MRLVVVACVIAFGARDVCAEVHAHATRRTQAITIDGRPDEDAWRSATRSGAFTQRFPVDGAPAALPTEFAVLYDDDSLYVGVWASDPDPAQVRATLARRDARSASSHAAFDHRGLTARGRPSTIVASWSGSATG